MQKKSNFMYEGEFFLCLLDLRKKKIIFKNIQKKI